MGLKLGEEVFRDIEITFSRNIPADEAAVVTMVNSLKGTISDETLLSQIPFVTDVQKELARVKAQKEENMQIFGGNLFNTEEDDESEELDMEE